MYQDRATHVQRTSIGFNDFAMESNINRELKFLLLDSRWAIDRSSRNFGPSDFRHCLKKSAKENVTIRRLNVRLSVTIIALLHFVP